MSRWLLLILLVVLALPLTAQETPVPTPGGDLTEADLALFDYMEAPFDVEIVGEEMDGDVTVQDIAYRSVIEGETIEAYLVIPPGDGPFPAVLYVHGSGANRTQFLNEAVDFAASDGVAALLVSTAWSDPDWFTDGRSFETDYQDAINHVIELRRAVDVLTMQAFVDPARLGFVGRDFGGTFGATMAGVEGRLSAYVLIAANSNFVNWILRTGSENFGIPNYVDDMASISALRFIPNAAPAALFFQFDSGDRFTQPDDHELFFEAASEPKQRATYRISNRTGRAESIADRQAFLREYLGLPADPEA